MEEERITFLVKVREFSNVDLHRADADFSRFIDYSVDCEGGSYSDINDYKFYRNDSIVVYPNGRDIPTERHVSLEFRFLSDEDLFWIDHIDLTLMVHIVDVDGNKRLPQYFSFTWCPTQGTTPNFFVENFVSHSFLLTDADELVPQDTLTLRVDVDLKGYYQTHELKKIVSDSIKEGGGGGEPRQHRLLLDSPLVRRLRKESRYFDRMFATPMVEKNSGYVNIPDEEFDTFMAIVKILFHLQFYDTTLQFTFRQIVEAYALADFYMLESVLDTCRRWLLLVCCTGDDCLTIARLTDLYDDHILREISKITLESTERIQRESDEEWTYRSHYKHSEDGSIMYRFEWSPEVRDYKGHTGFNNLVSESIEEEEDGGTQRRHHLLLDSPLGRRLRRESRYFERMFATPMVEKNSGHVNIPGEEFDTFVVIAKILFHLEFHTPLEFTFKQILDFYSMADFYGIESVLDTCRSWLKLVSRTSDDFSAISRLADLHDDQILRKIEGSFKRKERETYKQWTYMSNYAPSKDGSIIYRFEWTPQVRDSKSHAGFKDAMSESIKEERGGGERRQRHLLLDSPLGRHLRRESRYFKRMFATPMAEASCEYVNIPSEEFDTFEAIAKILFHLEFDTTLQFTFKQILDIYALADFYMMESVLDTCRRWLTLACFTRQDALAISRLADLHSDHILRKIAERASRTVERGKLIESYFWSKKWFSRARDMPSEDGSTVFCFEWLPKTGQDVGDISNCHI